MNLNLMERITAHFISNIYILRSIIFQTKKYLTNIYMIIKTRDYVDRHFQETKQEYNDVDDVILKSALVYQYLHIRNLKIYISIDEILELNNNEIGLIGPGNGCLTQFLERILGQSAVLHSHSILHDAYGRFYARPSFIRPRVYIYHTREPNTKMCEKISIMWSDFWIDILRIWKYYNINNIYERTTKKYIQLESYFR